MYASDATELLALHEGRYWHGLRVFPPRSTARKQIRLRKRGKRTFQTLLMTSDNGFRGGLASLGQTDDINIVIAMKGDQGKKLVQRETRLARPRKVVSFRSIDPSIYP
jgi:hypothetical protein